MSYAGGSEGVTEAKSPRLLDQVRARLRLKHYSLRTEQAYVGWIRRFILANGKRHSRDIGEDEVEALKPILVECEFLIDGLLDTRWHRSLGAPESAHPKPVHRLCENARFPSTPVTERRE